jgi:hypothetical protein
MHLQKGFNNIISPSVFNLVILIILVLILLLVYIKTNKFELFSTTDPNPTTLPTNTSIKQIISNSPLTNFINQYINKVNQKNQFSTILNNRQPKINSLSNSVLSLINPSF